MSVVILDYTNKTDSCVAGDQTRADGLLENIGLTYIHQVETNNTVSAGWVNKISSSLLKTGTKVQANLNALSFLHLMMCMMGFLKICLSLLSFI